MIDSAKRRTSHEAGPSSTSLVSSRVGAIGYYHDLGRNVNDSGGAFMTGVAITAVDEGTRKSYSAVTTAEGYYSIQFIKAGTYAITASIKGFETVRKPASLSPPTR